MKSSFPLDKKNGIAFLSDPAPFAEKNRCYLDVREREGRVLSDEQVQQLPVYKGPNNQLRREWRWRNRSYRRLATYLGRRYARQEVRLLDLGCGNGWMAMRLAGLPQTEVWAVDINLPELEQGARVAAGQANIAFVFANILENTLPAGHFDTVVLAASVQYFQDLGALIAAIRRVLKTGGEIHIIDSPFYPDGAKRAVARSASAAYYQRVGVPEMADWYHHHLWSDLRELGRVQIMNSPLALLLQRLRWLSPFPWVRIRT